MVPNVALVVAMLPSVKQYAVGAGMATAAELDAGYGQIPLSVLPLFFAMRDPWGQCYVTRRYVQRGCWRYLLSHEETD